MNKRTSLLAIVSIALVLVFGAAWAVPPDYAPEPPKNPPQEPPEPDPPEPPDDPGRPDESDVAMPNLSFPSIHTDVIDLFHVKECVDMDGDGTCTEDEWFLVFDDEGAPIPIPVVERIQDEYAGTHPGIEDAVHVEYVLDPATGCPVDANLDGEPDVVEVPLIDHLLANAPWYPQPQTITDDACIGDPNRIWDATCVEPSNSWQADWSRLEYGVDEPLSIDFVDWADVLEAIPEWEIGKRVPISVTLYEKTGDAYEDGGWGETTTAYDTSLLEYQGGPDELFGLSEGEDGGFTREIYFATVLTNRYWAEVWNPDGTHVRIKIVPTLNPDGTLNFKSSGFGFIPEMTGVHRIWIHFNDPMLTLTGAVVNDIGHYVLATGCMADEMDWLKALKTGIMGDSTFVEVNVVEARGDDPPPTPKPR